MADILKDPKTDIIIVDDQHPEAIAMIQALYSRDPRSVNVHLEEVRTRGYEKFMERFYVGYGHKSIGDCGSTTLFFENGSLLLPKVVQDWRLYNGQEASTRYLDMKGQDIINPCEGEDGQMQGKIILESWMKLYGRIIEELVPVITERFPAQPEQNPSVYEKAVKAKAFDIARGFLPAGITTYASWHTNLRQAYDHLHEMLHHPLKEMRETAKRTLDELKKKYPSSFSHKEYSATEEYLAKSIARYAYFDLDTIPDFSVVSSLDLTELKKHSDILSTRPMKTELPAKFEKFGQLKMQFPLDFGSFRDLQRHRSGICEMPLLSTKHGFHAWYLDQLPQDLRDIAVTEIDELTKLISLLPCDQYTKQYYTAIGFNVACEFTGGLPSIVYIAELRASQTVHPTLRIIAQKMGEYLREQVPYMSLHHDMSPDQWDVKRGTQDIVKK